VVHTAIKDILGHPGYKGDHPQKVDIPIIIEPALWTWHRKAKDQPSFASENCVEVAIARDDKMWSVR